MVKLMNMGTREFRQYIQNKKIYIYGAGRALESCLDIYFSDSFIEKIIDQDSNKWGKIINFNNQNIEIIGLNEFKLIMKNENICREECILIITSPFYAYEIIHLLDEYSEFNGLRCFIQVLIRNTYEAHEKTKFTKGEQLIPKKIHFIWIGEKKLPDEYNKYIASWKKYNPDYEIIKWDENNYDFTSGRYIKEAYEAKAWGFVTNYVRLDIIYRYGGIYLDTDVEAISNFDKMLNDKAFFCMGSYDRINTGCGFGGVKNHPIFKDMMNEFNKIGFLVDGKPNKRPCHAYINPIIKKYGFNIDNQYQNNNKIALYTKDIMSPLTIEGMKDDFTESTVSIHHEKGTWKNEDEKKGTKDMIKLIERIKHND